MEQEKNYRYDVHCNICGRFTRIEEGVRVRVIPSTAFTHEECLVACKRHPKDEQLVSNQLV
jgi:hypothetical protein